MLGTLHLFVKFFVVLALLHWLNTDFWVLYDIWWYLLVIFGFGFLAHAQRFTENICKINDVGLDTCLTVYLTIFCTYAYIIRRLNRGSLLPNAFRGLPGWFADCKSSWHTLYGSSGSRKYSWGSVQSVHDSIEYRDATVRTDAVYSWSDAIAIRSTLSALQLLDVIQH